MGKKDLESKYNDKSCFLDILFVGAQFIIAYFFYQSFIGTI